MGLSLKNLKGGFVMHQKVDIGVPPSELKQRGAMGLWKAVFQSFSFVGPKQFSLWGPRLLPWVRRHQGNGKVSS